MADAALGIKLVYVLGITNLMFILLVLFTCRCLLGKKIVGRLWNYAWYKKLYARHCIFWWFFIASVILHTILAFIIFGNPF